MLSRDKESWWDIVTRALCALYKGSLLGDVVGSLELSLQSHKENHQSQFLCPCLLCPLWGRQMDGGPFLCRHVVRRKFLCEFQQAVGEKMELASRGAY